MSTVKHPEEKKLLSLKHDRRNVYGENAKSSRKNIPLAKQLSNQAGRSSVARVLAKQRGVSTDLDVEKIESLTASKEVQAKRKRFKKWRDAPLFSVLIEKKTEAPLGSVFYLDNSLKRVQKSQEKLKSASK